MYIETSEVQRRLGNAFRVGLRQLSAIDGTAGEAGDQGQPIPTGLLDSTACRTSAERQWRCVVRWSDLGAHGHLTSYVVMASGAACFTAHAEPPLATIRDVVAAADSIHPLQELSGASRC